MKPVHIIVESGPDKGVEFTIPLEGARVGRSTSNDIVLNDPSISRFQCRYYFKNDIDLAISDLASTNDTMVNDRKIQDVQLHVGDRIMVGETVMKVMLDTITLDAHATAAGAAALTPPADLDSVRLTPAASPSVTAPPVIDLGLERSAPQDRPGGLLPHFRKLLVAGGITLGVIALAAAVMLVLNPAPEKAGGAQTAPALELQYEKIDADQENIFRYALTLKDGLLTVRVDNLQENRKISREARPDPKVLSQLAEQLARTGFMALEAEYVGLQPNVWDAAELSVTLDRKTHQTRVINRVEPDAFKTAREYVEEFGKAEVGLWALALTPEKLKELAAEAWLQGQKMFDQREVRYENLALAIKAITETEALLETVEPKPDYYAEALSARDECKRLLQTRYEDYLFRADRAIKLRDWPDANNNLQVIIQMIPDRTDERYKTAYKKLVAVQRNLDRSR